MKERALALFRLGYMTHLSFEPHAQ